MKATSINPNVLLPAHHWTYRVEKKSQVAADLARKLEAFQPVQTKPDLANEEEDFLLEEDDEFCGVLFQLFDDEEDQYSY